MKKETPTLKADIRTKHGSRYTQRARAEGKIPGVVYGHKMDPVSVAFEGTALLERVNAGDKVFKLDLPGTKNADEGQMVLLKAVQFDYLGTNLIHVDFARVDLNERVTTKVHVQLKGDAKGLKTTGAILMHPTNELLIECKVTDIPESITVDISELDMDQQITAGQVKLPSDDMKLLTDTHAVVAQIVEAKEEVVAEATAVVAEAAAPEVIGEKERLEKAAAKEGGPGAKPGAPAPGTKPGAPAAGAKPGAAPAKGAAPAPKK
jgi:large subunit ribosomal protein L25